jgi:hypothetical protein
MNFLEKPLGRPTRMILTSVFCLIPTAFVASQYLPGHGLTKLVDVGWIFLPRALPQFQALDPVTPTEKGYDGQFYAQIAIDPTLRDPHFRTMGDNPEYLGRRILMSALAWGLAFGRPAAAVTIYSLLNLIAWYALFALILSSQRPMTAQAWCCVAGIMLGTGVFASISHSLTDLPAAMLLVMAAVLAGWSRAIALSLSVLTREASLVSSWAPILDLPKSARLWRGIAQMSVIILPWVAWSIYLHWLLNHPEYFEGNFAWPFEGWLQSIMTAVAEVRLSKLLALLSLLVQLAYLIRRPQLSSFYWRIAISYGIVGSLLGSGPLGGEASFTRDLLPMTIGFNVLMLKEPQPGFPFWFLAGNIGLCFGLVRALIQICSSSRWL